MYTPSQDLRILQRGVVGLPTIQVIHQRVTFFYHAVGQMRCTRTRSSSDESGVGFAHAEPGKGAIAGWTANKGSCLTLGKL